MKKLILGLVFIFISLNAISQHALEKIWESDSILKTPESVLFDAKSKILYVSNIGEFDKEGSGFISKLDLNGNVVERNWVSDLTATKGMGLFNDRLYAAEMSTVAVIDVSSGQIVQRIPVEGAQMLNDITVDPDGIVYVSDTRAGKVHKIENGKPSLYLENLKSPNGLLSVGNILYVLADGKLLKTGSDRTSTQLADGMEGGTDGIEMVKDSEFIISCWQGVIYYVKSDGSKQLLLDTRDQKINTADIGYDAQNQIVYVPTFGKNNVVAYKLK